MPPSTLRKYRIPPGRSINVTPLSQKKPGVPMQLLTGKHPSGRLVTADDVPAEYIPGYVKNGSLIPLSEATPDLSGIEGAVLGIDSVRNDFAHQRELPLTKPEEVDAKPMKKIQHRSDWDTAPEKLLGKDLETLNFMVKERDPNMAPFETTEEAIAMLTKDYRGPKG